MSVKKTFDTHIISVYFRKSFLYILPAELKRVNPSPFEFLHKMPEIIEPAFQTDLRDLQFGRTQ